MMHATFLSKMNWKIIVLHLLASWFFMTGFFTLSFLTNIQIAEAFKSFIPFTGAAWWGNSVNSFVLTIYFAGFAGLIISFIVSLFICIRKKWFWLNALIVFLLSILLYKFYWEFWNMARPFAWFIGEKMESIFLQFLINGIMLLGIGLFIFFSKWNNKFIQRNKEFSLNIRD